MTKGVYVLLISIATDAQVAIGGLGTIDFEKGLYAYAGSAQNSLEERVMRHLRKNKQKFWHIDYLLDNDAVKILKVLYKEADKHEECEIAEKLAERGIFVESFGCSDCKCKSHLFKLEGYEFLKESMHELRI